MILFGTEGEQNFDRRNWLVAILIIIFFPWVCTIIKEYGYYVAYNNLQANIFEINHINFFIYLRILKL